MLAFQQFKPAARLFFALFRDQIICIAKRKKDKRVHKIYGHYEQMGHEKGNGKKGIG